MKLLIFLFALVSIAFANDQKDFLQQSKSELKKQLECRDDVREPLRIYNDQLKIAIVRLFETAAQEENADFSYALYCVGSTAMGIATPQSDLEFGFLIDDENNRSKSEKLLARFTALVIQSGICPDQNWYSSPILGIDIQKGFIATSAQLMHILLLSTRLISSILFTQIHFLAGSRQLFDDFIIRSDSLDHSAFVNKVTESERACFLSNCGYLRAVTEIDHLKKLHAARQTKNSKFDEFLLDPKKVFYRWVVNYMTYLNIINSIQERNPFAALNALVSKGCLTPINGKRAADCIQLGLWLRCRFSDKVSTTLLSNEQIEMLLHVFEEGTFFYQVAAKTICSSPQ